MNGLELLKVLVRSTGLPEAWLEKKITQLLEARGVSVETLTLEDLREFTVDLLQDCINESGNEGPIDQPGPN